MQHIHLKECSSTQEYLKDLLVNGIYKEILVSTEKQTGGIGRRGNTWIQGSSSLAFSFTLKPNEVISLTSLEVGVLISKFFKGIDLKLKWPNDLIFGGLKKCGGILCQTFENYLVVGVGINFGTIDFSVKDSNIEISSLPLTPHQKEMPVELYDFILKNRLDPFETKKEWNNLCAHQNQKVIVENETGFFWGIGDNGEMLLKTATGLKKIFSGSLIFSPTT